MAALESDDIKDPSEKLNENHCSEIQWTGSKSMKDSLLRIIRKRLIAILTFLAIILGFVIGFTVRLFKPSDDVIMWIGLPGELFLNILSMPIVPLVCSSVVTATASMSPKENGKVGLIYLIYTVIANTVTTLLGILLSVAIKPGVSVQSNAPSRVVTSEMTTADLIADLIRNCLPSNIIRATIQQQVTTYTAFSTEYMHENTSNTTSYQTEQQTQRHVEFTNSTNILGLIFCSAMFGLAISQAGERGVPLLNVFRSTLDVVLILLSWFLWTVPIGMMSLIASSISVIDDITLVFIRLGMFVITVVIGLFIHQVIWLPLVHVIFVRSNPYRVHLISFKAWCVAFASTSSAGAMPYMFLAAAKMRVSDTIASLCIPMGATFNASGSVIFISSAVIFLAQINSLSLGVSHLMTLFVLTSLSGMALPPIPSSSLVIIVIQCSIFSIPSHSVGMLFAVEWLLDRLRTTSNVLCEMFALAFVWKRVKKDFQPKENQNIELLKQSNVVKKI